MSWKSYWLRHNRRYSRKETDTLGNAEYANKDLHRNNEYWAFFLNYRTVNGPHILFLIILSRFPFNATKMDSFPLFTQFCSDYNLKLWSLHACSSSHTLPCTYILFFCLFNNMRSVYATIYLCLNFKLFLWNQLKSVLQHFHSFKLSVYS